MKIFLDDVRDPSQCADYMLARIGLDAKIYLTGGWYIVRTYKEFVEAIRLHWTIIDVVSFDHDLADGHYHKNTQEGKVNYSAEDFNTDACKTGYHCAMYLKSFYEPHLGVYAFPKVFIHSMNPVGVENIKAVFANDSRRMG